MSSRSTVDPQAAPVRDEILDTIRRHVAVDFCDGRSDHLAADAPLVSSGIIDSAGVLHLVDWLEHRFGVRIGDDEVTPENFDTLADLSELIARLAG